MTKNVNFLGNKKSKAVVEGKPKLPLATDLVEGEIAVNYAKGTETLAIVNESGDVVTFSSDNNFYTKSEINTYSAATDNRIKALEEGGSGSSGGFVPLTNPTDNTKVGLVNSLSQYYDTNIGKYAIIEGDGANANYKIKASGDYSHAEGYNTEATEIFAHAEGFQTTASGESSHAEGSYTKASGDYSHAEGGSTIASGSSSHAEGQGTKANGYSSHAEGGSTIASGNTSHAEGSYTTASGNYSHAEGSSTTASGEKAHAEGSSTKASGDYGSHAEGNGTTARGESAHAEGDGTEANGEAAHAEGYSTIASGKHSHTEGSGTQANNMFEHASGYFNISSSASTTFGNSGNTLFSVGNGTNYKTRHNAFEIRQNGDIYISSGGTTTSQMIKLQDNLGGGTYINANADWDEVDEQAPSFIKNKPFGESSEVVNIYTNPSKGLSQCGQHCFGDLMGYLYLSENLIEGDVYTVDINGNEMDFTASTYNDSVGLNWNGNPSTVETVSVFYTNSGYGTGYSISINDSLLNGNTSTASITISKNLSVITQIDSKFVDAYTKAEANTTFAKKSDIPSIWIGTEAEYDALTTKDNNTIYVIK